MTGNRSEVADVAHCVEEILASARTSFSEDELRKHTEYLSASAWRFSTTLSVARNHYALPLQGSCIVDIGAYPGHIAAVLSQIDKANVTAVTLITNPQFESLMSSLGVRVALCDVERDPLPLDSGLASVVLCCELIEHLDGDVLNMLRQARRVTANNGLFVLTTPNHARIANRWALLRGRSVYPPLDLPDYPFYAGAGIRNPMRHVREFTCGEIKDFLTQAGFSKVTTMTASPPPGDGHGLSWRGRIASKLLRIWERATPNGGSLLIAVARP